MDTKTAAADRPHNHILSSVLRYLQYVAAKKKYIIPPAAALAFLFTPALLLGSESSPSQTTPAGFEQPQPLNGGDFEFLSHSTLKQVESLPGADVSGQTKVEVQTNNPANTEVQINEQSIPVPDNGNVKRQVQSEDGSTMAVEVYVNNQASGDTTSESSITVESHTSSNLHKR